MQSNKLYALFLCVFINACEINVDADYNEGSGNQSSSGEASKADKSKTGKCALHSIVGEFEGGVSFSADCILKIADDKLTILSEGLTYHTDYSVPQTVFGTWFSDQEDEICEIQELDDELIINCGDMAYRGHRIE